MTRYQVPVEETFINLTNISDQIYSFSRQNKTTNIPVIKPQDMYIYFQKFQII